MLHLLQIQVNAVFIVLQIKLLFCYICYTCYNKIFLKNYKKSIDIWIDLWYNIVKNKRGINMINEKTTLILISLTIGSLLLNIFNLFLPTLSGLMTLIPFFGSYILGTLIVYFMYKIFW